jgi:hypothetical protein
MIEKHESVKDITIIKLDQPNQYLIVKGEKNIVRSGYSKLNLLFEELKEME